MKLLKVLCLFLPFLFSIASNAQTTPGITQKVIGGDTVLIHLPIGYTHGQLVNIMIGAPGEGEATGPISKDTINGSFATWSGKPGIKDTTSNATLDPNLVVMWCNPQSASAVQAFFGNLIIAIRDTFNVNKLAVMGLSEGCQDWGNFAYYSQSQFNQINAWFICSPEPANGTPNVTFGGGPIPKAWWANDSTYIHIACATADPDGFWYNATNTYDSVLASGNYRHPLLDSLTCACHSSSAWGPMFSPYVNQTKTGMSIYKEFMTQYPVSGTPTAATPTFSPVAGSYVASQTVTISTTTSGATIYYTTNGTTPTTSSSVYSTPITVSASETVQAIAAEVGYTNSGVGSAVYTITGGGGVSLKYKFTMGNSEYTDGFLDSAGHAWAVSTDTLLLGAPHGVQGIPVRIVTTPANKVMKGVYGGLHDMCFVSADSGYVFYIGSNNYGQQGTGNTTQVYDAAFELLTDSFGHQFNNIAMVSGGWGPVSSVPFYCAIKTTPGDTVWVWGDLADLGRGTLSKPVPYLLPYGQTPAKIYAYNSSIHVISTLDSVYVVGGTDDYPANTGINATPTVFTHVSGLSNIGYIAKGNAFAFAVTNSGDSVWGWGEYGWQIKGLSTPTYDVEATPILLNSYLSAVLPLDTLVCDHVAAMGVKSDSTLWSWGSNEVGSCGTGPTINWSTYQVWNGTDSVAEPWNWFVGQGEYCTPVTQIAPGKHNFITAFGGPEYSFYFYAEDANGNVFFAGRNKAAGSLNGIIPADTLGSRIAGAYHMSWNENYLTPAFPLGVTVSSVTSCPGCASGQLTGDPCAYGTDAPSGSNTNLHASLTATAVGNTIYLSNASSTTDGSHKINYRVLTQTAGTSIPLGIQTATTDTLASVANGTYTFSQTVTDNGWNEATTTTSVTVGSISPLPYFIRKKRGKLKFQ